MRTDEFYWRLYWRVLFGLGIATLLFAFAAAAVSIAKGDEAGSGLSGVFLAVVVVKLAGDFRAYRRRPR